MGSLLKGGCQGADDFMETPSVRGRMKKPSQLEKNGKLQKNSEAPGKQQVSWRIICGDAAKEQDPGEGTKTADEGEQASPGNGTKP